MDKKLIDQYGTEILSYRLRTVRQRKRMQYEGFDKRLLRLNKERDQLYQIEKNLGWEPLIPPVQKGWKRFYVLRDDVARSKHSEFFENILKKINTYEWSWRKDFLIRKKRYGKNKYTVKPQCLLRPCEDHFKRLGFTDVEKSFFYEAWKMDSCKRLVKYYVFSEPWRFVLRVRPNMIDKVKRRDAEIDKRQKEIDNYLERNYYEIRLNKLLAGDVWHWSRDFGENYREKNVLQNKPLPRILDECAQGLL